MNKVIALLLVFTVTSLTADDFIITDKLPKTNDIKPQPIIGANIDWNKFPKSKPSLPKVTTYGAFWCGGCETNHAQQIANQADPNRTFDWEYIDIGRGNLPDHMLGFGNQIPITAFENGKPLVGLLTVSSVQGHLKERGYSGFLSPVSIGSISRSSVGLTKTASGTTLNIGGMSGVFSSDPVITLDPPMVTGNGTISVSITKVRFTKTQLILTAKGWPVEFALDLK